jgi:glutamate formiminotransferase/formiminotetrahydrofolate cyclodeaminase
MKLIECVPNISEGINLNVIEKIANEVKSVKGVKLLNVDPGKATNRTVITFVGDPEDVIEAAFLLIKKAGELIDMSRQHGEHPRMGATDVCPLIPISGVTMEETAEYARRLAKRVGLELQLPVYLYEQSQPDQKRNNLSLIRAGEYEGFFKKIKLPEWAPDFGPVEYDTKRGATVIGARDYLIAYNVNLDTTSTRIANSIASNVRETGRKLRSGDPVEGPIVLDEQGKAKNIPGTLKAVKAIGWFIEEYGIAQISMNLTNLHITPLHIAFEEVSKSAEIHGVKVTGSELIGLIPLQAMLNAGRYFQFRHQRSIEVGDEELITVAIKTMGLDELSPFDPQKRIIEYII